MVMDGANLFAQRIDTEYKGQTKQYITVYNIKKEKVTEIFRKYNGRLWLNKNKSIYSYNKNNELAAKLTLCWYNNDWVNVWLDTYFCDKSPNQAQFSRLFWNGAQWIGPSNKIFGGLFNYRDHVKWKMNDASWLSGRIVGMSKMGSCGIVTDDDTTHIVHISFHAIQPFDTIEVKR
jgi:hypothetical protein